MPVADDLPLRMVVLSRYYGTRADESCLRDISARQVRMAPRKKETYKKPKKVCWHLYSLQVLTPEKFIKVINKILRREFSVIK
jgi:hypothetical protein